MNNIIDFKKYHDKKYKKNPINQDLFLKIIADSFEIDLSDIEKKLIKD